MEEFIIDEHSQKLVWNNRGQYWYSPKNGKIINSNELTEIEIPADITQSQYLISKGYIPYTAVREEEIIHAYTSSLSNKKLASAINSIDSKNISDTFWKYHNAYPEISNGYTEFEQDYVRKKLISWCEENGIKFIVK